MNCPSCNAANCYLGLNVIECINNKCAHFKVPSTPIFTASQKPLKDNDLKWHIADFFQTTDLYVAHFSNNITFEVCYDNGWRIALRLNGGAQIRGALPSRCRMFEKYSGHWKNDGLFIRHGVLGAHVDHIFNEYCKIRNEDPKREKP